MDLGETYDLDEIDRLLLGELQADAKISLQKLGERVDLSAPSVMERIRKLEHAGVITGYHAVVDARRVGLDIAAFIGVAITNPKQLAAFESWVDAVPQILECHHVTGEHTLLLKVKTENTRALEQLISRIRSLEGVAGTETMIVLSTHAERAQVPLEPDGPVLVGRSRKRARKKATA